MSQELKDTGESAYRVFLKCLDRVFNARLNTEIIRNTPKRAAISLVELTTGYTMKENEVLGKQFEEKACDLIYETIEFYSLCEHHLLPFFGKVHIAYMPYKKVLGLSKLARLVEMYSRRLQIQERLTNQIADALWFNEGLRSKGVFVMVEGQHLCMMMRGIRKQRAETVTRASRGTFAIGEDAHRHREEVLQIIRRGKETQFRHTSIRKIKREAKINNPVIIPESLIEKLKPYGPHFIKVAKPILGDTKTGKNAIEQAWQEHPYEANDPEVQNWIKAGNNYGIIASWGIAQIDLDEKESQAILETRIKTFTVKSGRINGKGRHYYFHTNATENGIIFDKDNNQVGNVQVHNKFVVGPGCHHNSGGTYQIINDVPFARISKEDLENIFGDQLKWTGQIRKKDTEEVEDEKMQIGKEIALATLFDLSNFRQRGIEYQGSHPLHGSTTGTNFCVNIKENVWHCFRCNSGGGGLMWIAVKYGLLKCHEAQKGALRGIKFIQALKLAKEKENIDIKVPDEDINPDVARFFEEDKKGKLRFVPALVVKELMEETKYVTRLKDQTIFKYNFNRGIYEEILDIAIGKLIAKKLGKHWISTRENEIIGFLKRKTVDELPGLEDGLIAVKNGILNIYTRELQSFSPELFVINALPIIYDPKADCPKYKIFLVEIVPPEPDRESLQQFLGYTLSPNCRYQKAIMLVGIGANGKSTLLAIWMNLLGYKNVSNVPLQSIQSHKFALARLYGKMANIYTDLPAIALKETDVFKALVSGDMVEGEEKFKALFSFMNIAKLIFSCNQVPPTPDNSIAFFRRWIIIMFPNQFLENDPKTNPNLTQELTTPEELSGILNWALDGLEKLMKQDKFTVSKTTEDIKIQYTFLSDPAKAFADTKVELSFDDTHLEKQVVYEAYLDFCKTYKLPAITKRTFAEEFPRHIPGVTASYTTRDNQTIRTWRGIKFKKEEDDIE